MSIGTLFLASISTGIITQEEMWWVTRNQSEFSRCEQATVLRLGQLIDSGQLQLGSRPWILSIEHFNDFYLISMTTSSLISNQDLLKDRQFLRTGLSLSSSLLLALIGIEFHYQYLHNLVVLIFFESKGIFLF